MPTPNSKQHITRTVLATTLAVAALFALLTAARSGAKVNADAAGAWALYLPIVYGGPQPAGSYYCYEYEFGLIWTSEVITLNMDGSSVYAYNPPASSIVSGTWSYSHTLQEVAFTNFRWLTATFTPPDQLYNSAYLPGPGFEIAISCLRQ